MAKRKFDQISIDKEVTTIANAETAQKYAESFKKADVNKIFGYVREMYEADNDESITAGMWDAEIMTASAEIIAPMGRRPYVYMVFFVTDGRIIPDEIRRITAQYDIDAEAFDIFGAAEDALDVCGVIYSTISYKIN